MLRVIKKDLKPARHQEPDSEEDDEDFLGIEEDEIDEAETGETGEIEEQTDDSKAVVLRKLSRNYLKILMEEWMMMLCSEWKLTLPIFSKRGKIMLGVKLLNPKLVLFNFPVLSLLEIFLHETPGKFIVILVRPIDKEVSFFV